MKLKNKERFIFVISAENTKSTTSDDFLDWKGFNTSFYVDIITRPDIYGLIFSKKPLTKKDYEEIKHMKF